MPSFIDCNLKLGRRKLLKKMYFKNKKRNGAIHPRYERLPETDYKTSNLNHIYQEYSRLTYLL